jgi:hypothetical protein
MFAEFNWWLLIVGLVVGAGLAWLVLGDARRREEDIEEAELADEAVWLEGAMTEAGTPMDLVTAEQMLQLHRRYLGLPRPEAPDAPDELGGGRAAAWQPPTAALDDEAAPPTTVLAAHPPSTDPDPPPPARPDHHVSEDEPTVRSRS